MLTRDDIVGKKDFSDGCVPSTWSIDLHFPKEEYAKKFPENPFISVAKFDARIDRQYGYPIPYRCLYSVNIDNLFMAGRDISVTDEALGTIRVMRTIGMMGEVVGKAAAIAVQRGGTPRDVYAKYWSELDSLLQLPGRARRANLEAPFQIVGPEPTPVDDNGGRGGGVNPANLPGIVIDNKAARLMGTWTTGSNLEHIGNDYVFARGPGHTAVFPFTVPADGRYEVRFATAPHENRASNTAVVVRHADGTTPATLNQRQPAPIGGRWISLGFFNFKAGQPASVEVDAAGADGNVHLDAVQVLPAN